MSVKSNKNKQYNQERQKTSGEQRLKRQVTCFYCQKRGHIAKECRKKKKELHSHNSTEKDQKKDNTSESSAFVVEACTNELMSFASKDVWYLDSGASKHMTFRHDWFSELQPFENEYVSLGNGTTCKVMGRGTIHIKRLVNGKWLDGKMEDVFYVPSLSKSLFSIGAYINKNYSYF